MSLLPTAQFLPLLLAGIFSVARTLAAPVYSLGTGEGATDDLFDVSQGTALIASGLPSPAGEELVLNEMVSANSDSLRDNDGDSSDWIELFNGRDTAVALEGWGLSDDVDRPHRWTFPAVTLTARSHLVVFASGKDRRTPGAALHTNFQLQSGGERVLLTTPQGTLHDQIDPVRLKDDVSFARHPNGTGSWKFLAQPTPRRANNSETPYDSIVFEPPQFSHSSGFYTNAFEAVVTTAEQDVTLRITVDGSEPQEESPAYSQPLAIRSRASDPNVLSLIRGTATANEHTDGWKAPSGLVRKATVVRARATRPGAIAGPVVTRTYFIGEDAKRTDGLPTLSIVTDPDGLFDYERGIYMLGSIFDRYVAAHPGEGLTGHTPANYTQRGPEWERSAHLDWFEPDGRLGFAEPVLIDIQGQSSRSFRQKSFGVKARGTEAPRNTIVYSIFPELTRLGDDTPLQEFRHLRLRNLGNDWEYAFMRDDWCHRLVSGLGLNVMSSRYVTLFLDGEYWGVLAAREQQDPRYVEAHYGVDDDEVIILHGNGALEEGVAGDEQAWLNLLNFCQTRDLSVPANYQHVTNRVDSEDALFYFFSQIYFGNADWPQNNIRVWRRRLNTPDASLGRGRDGRWRWFLFDVDLGVSHPWSGGVNDDTLAAAMSRTGRPGFDSPWGTAVFRALLTNPEWKQEFLRTASDLLNSWFSTNRAVTLVETMRGELRPAMNEHIRRWRANGGSVLAWETHAQTVWNFANQRTSRLRSQIQRQFRLAGQSRLTLSVNDPARGKIRVNRLLVDPSLPGVSVPPYPWTGIYFNGVPVTLEAVAEPGWQFSGWTGLEADGPVGIWTPLGHLEVVAEFVAEPPTIIEASVVQGVMKLIFSGRPGATYGLHTGGALGSWSDAGEFSCGLDGRGQVDLPLSADVSLKFVRAVSR